MPNTALRTAAGLAGLLSGLLFAGVASAAPSGTFTIAPEAPNRVNVGQNVTITPANVVFDGASATGTIGFTYGDSVNSGTATTHAYANPGTYQIFMFLTNTEGGAATLVGPRTVIVNAPPVAAFGWDPLSPFLGADVHFGSESDDPDGGIQTYAWDFGDGVTSGLRNPFHPFTSLGDQTVTLKVTDAWNASDTVTDTVTVKGVPQTPTLNKPPIANFAFGPRSPLVGDSVEFSSSAVDPDGNLRSQTWDLDGDGQFDDARGDEVLYTFDAAGTHTVRLRAEDDDNGAAVRQRTVTVSPRPKAKAGFLTPVPVVSLNGTILDNGARIKELSVQAPRGSLVTVKCRGKSCGRVHERRKRIKSGVVRFKTYQRFLRAGVRLEIFIRRPNTIGTYVRYTIRAGKGPVRARRCLEPGKPKPQRRCG